MGKSILNVHARYHACKDNSEVVSFPHQRTRKGDSSAASSGVKPESFKDRKKMQKNTPKMCHYHDRP